MLQLIDEVLADPGISHMIKSANIWTSADFMTKVGILENPPADWKDMSSQRLFCSRC
jgi:hypothetical protein